MRLSNTFEQKRTMENLINLKWLQNEDHKISHFDDQLNVSVSPITGKILPSYSTLPSRAPSPPFPFLLLHLRL